MENQQVFILTREKMEELEAELAELKGPRTKENTQKIKEARAQGDLSENAEYSAAREEQGHIQGRIAEIETILKNVQIIESNASDASDSEKVIKVGSTVKLMDVTYDEEVEYAIVGSMEADPREGRISNDSPLGKALLGHKVGEEIYVDLGDTQDPYKILEIK